MVAPAASGRDGIEHPDKAVCRVCAARSAHGVEPEAEEVAGISAHEGKHYYFCSQECKAEFDASPDWWVPMEFPFAVPATEVRSLEGEVVPLPGGDGKLMILDFWATWCQPCRKTMRALQRRHEGGGEGLEIVGVSIDEGEDALEKVRKAVKKQGIRYPIFLDDQESPAWVALKVHAVPTMMLVDGRRGVVWRFTGPDGDERLEEALARLERGPVRE